MLICKGVSERLPHFEYYSLSKLTQPNGRVKTKCNLWVIFSMTLNLFATQIGSMLWRAL